MDSDELQEQLGERSALSSRWRSFIVRGAGQYGGRHLAGYVREEIPEEQNAGVPAEIIEVKFGEHELRDSKRFFVTLGQGGRIGVPLEDMAPVVETVDGHQQVNFLEQLGRNLSFRPNGVENALVVGKVAGARKSVALVHVATNDEQGYQRWWVHQEGAWLVGFEYAGNWSAELLVTQETQENDRMRAQTDAWQSLADGVDLRQGPPDSPTIVRAVSVPHRKTPYQRQVEADDDASHVTVPMDLERLGIEPTEEVVEAVQALASAGGLPTEQARDVVGQAITGMTVTVHDPLPGVEAERDHWRTEAEQTAAELVRVSGEQKDRIVQLEAQVRGLEANEDRIASDLSAQLAHAWEIAEGRLQAIRVSRAESQKVADQHERDAAQWHEQLEDSRRFGESMKRKRDTAREHAATAEQRVEELTVQAQRWQEMTETGRRLLNEMQERYDRGQRYGTSQFERAEAAIQDRDDAQRWVGELNGRINRAYAELTGTPLVEATTNESDG